MPYGRNGKDANGKSRRLCLDLTCKTRIGTLKPGSKIIDRNYCAKHQPIDIEKYIKENIIFPTRHFNDNNKKKQWFDCVLKKMGLDITSSDAIYNVPRTKLKEYNGFNSVTNRCCIVELIIELYPELNLVWHKFNPRENGSLCNVKKLSELFEFTIKNELNLDIDLSINDVPNNSPLYKLTRNDVDGSFFNHYSSVYELINDLYPHLKLKPWLFSGLNYTFVKNNTININIIKEWFMCEIFSKYKFPDELSKDEKIRALLLNIKLQDFNYVPGWSFIYNHLNGSPYEFICKIFPEYKIRAWELNRLPNNYFNHYLDKLYKVDKEKIKELLIHIGNNEGWFNMDDYYNLTREIILKYIKYVRIFSSFQYKTNYIINILNYAFPEHHFDENKLENRSPHGCSNLVGGGCVRGCYTPETETGMKNLRIILDKHLQKYGFNTLDEHYNIRYDDFCRTPFAGIIGKYYNHNYIYLLENVYPENNYDILKFKRHKFNQVLYYILNEICIENNIHKSNINYEQQYPGLSNDAGTSPLRFDACVKVTINDNKYDILIEKDGEQHFHAVKYFGGEEKFKQQRRNDTRKHDYINSNKNLILIRISYKEFYCNETFNNIMRNLFKNILTNPEKKIVVSNPSLYSWCT